MARDVTVAGLVRSYVHDLNNALMVASSYCDLLSEYSELLNKDTGSLHGDRLYAQKAQSAVMRAAEIAKEISAALRQNVDQHTSRPVNIDRVVAGVVKQLSQRFTSLQIDFHPNTTGQESTIEISELARLMTDIVRSLCSQQVGKISISTGMLHADGASALSTLPAGGGEYAWISLVADDDQREMRKEQGSGVQEEQTQEVATTEDGQVTIHRSTDRPAAVLYLPCA